MSGDIGCIGCSNGDVGYCIQMSTVCIKIFVHTIVLEIFIIENVLKSQLLLKE